MAHAWVIVIDPPLQEAEAIGPFASRDEAAAFEDRHVDAPEGSRAVFLPIVSPGDYTRGE